MKNLILMAGIPGSGKSTWCKEYQKTHKNVFIIDTDETRKQITGSYLIFPEHMEVIFDEMIRQSNEIFAKYEGYIAKQRQEVERFMKLENKRLPEDMDYHAIKELSSEAAEKLDKVRPTNIGQASRISGVSPADISVLMIALELKRRKEQGE